MFKGWWHVLSDDERQQWMSEPYMKVGPLCFGMSPSEAEDALSDVATGVVQHTESGGHGDSWQIARSQYREFGLVLYYNNGRLAGVVVDALCGPQVFTDGMALVGRVPSVLEEWMRDRAETCSSDDELAYMSAGVPTSESLGVTINVQRDGDRLLSRPVFYPAEALHDLPHWLPDEVWMIR
ncbi:hypothetical protein ACFU7Y_18625 [Kitasatospora sp. NPDC057542]|uniref:hypothetical protein n=1 Tax=Kitasatospora sp. NPDC057542 TaxID=3346162 RepID=UPI0036B46F02